MIAESTQIICKIFPLVLILQCSKFKTYKITNIFKKYNYDNKKISS